MSGMLRGNGQTCEIVRVTSDVTIPFFSLGFSPCSVKLADFAHGHGVRVENKGHRCFSGRFLQWFLQQLYMLGRCPLAMCRCRAFNDCQSFRCLTVIQCRAVRCWEKGGSYQQQTVLCCDRYCRWYRSIFLDVTAVSIRFSLAYYDFWRAFRYIAFEMSRGQPHRQDKIHRMVCITEKLMQQTSR